MGLLQTLFEQWLRENKKNTVTADDMNNLILYDPIECSQDLPLDKYPPNFRVHKVQTIKDINGLEVGNKCKR